MEAPVLIKAIPSQGVNERAAYGPFDLTEYIKAPDDSELYFKAEVDGGAALPKGMICTQDGILTGIPAKGTRGHYEVTIEASNEAGSLQAVFQFSIQPNIAEKNTQEYVDDLKQQIWQALEHNTPMPEISDLIERAITPVDIYYLLERWATLTIYDAYNLDAPGEKQLLTLEGANEHYYMYDRGSCLVACPKDLFSHERTIADALQASKVLAREAYKRDWTVELIGFEKLTRAAWVEIQRLGDVHSKQLEVVNYHPTSRDVALYSQQVEQRLMSNQPE